MRLPFAELPVVELPVVRHRILQRVGFIARQNFGGREKVLEDHVYWAPADWGNRDAYLVAGQNIG